VGIILKQTNSAKMKLKWQEPEYRAKMAQRRTRRNRIDRICQYCGRHFSTIPSRLNAGEGKFCSPTCHYNSLRGRVLPTTVYVEKICQQCGLLFRLPARLLKTQAGKYCSRLCGNRAKANPADPKVKERKAKLVSITSKKRWEDPEYVARLSRTQKVAQRKKWQDPEFVAKMTAAFNKKPTKPEQRLMDIFSKNLPQFEYNGDFRLEVMVGGLIPDFVNVNGKKEIIEFFGDYYHSPEVIGDDWRRSELGKVMIYNSLGWNCLVIWGHELNESTDSEIVHRATAFFRSKR